MCSNREKAIRYLSNDECSHIDMLEPIRRGTADILYAEEDGVILYEQNSETCMISMQAIEKCQELIDFKAYTMFAVHQKEIADLLCGNGDFSHQFEVYQAVYRKKQHISGHFEAIRLLTPEYIDQVFEKYNATNSRLYIEILIDRKQLWGIFDEGHLAGFIGVHLEGSMGLLEIFPEYRRKGYGQQLESYLINDFLNRGETPFCQVVTANDKSIALQNKLGLEISEKTTIWLFN